MEAEGRSYSELYRNSSEEMFLKTLMESSIGMAAPNMEFLGLKNITQNFRADSEELFNTWLMNGENNGSIAHRTRQSSRRLTADLASLCNQQNGEAIHQNNSITLDSETDDNQQTVRNMIDKGLQANNLFMAKAWFHSSQPMTRSRSSELRRRYVAMQSYQMPEQNPTTRTADENICNIESLTETSNQITTPMPATMAGLDTISSVVSMLKGTLERKKLNLHTEKEVNAQEVVTYMSSNSQISTTQIYDPLQNYMNDFTNLQNIGDHVQGFAALGSQPVQISGLSQDQPSLSESSAVAPVMSNGFEICDGPASSGNNFSVSRSGREQIGNGSYEQGNKANGFRDTIIKNSIKEDRKRRSLVRLGSVTSAPSEEKADPTKKRRVERSQKMAEAKERNMTPAAASDAQTLLKRCENLEKEVRSLKLNLAFMNRKDSEQTKEIEELQKQNEDIGEEKERLLEEIERILSETGRM